MTRITIAIGITRCKKIQIRKGSIVDGIEIISKEEVLISPSFNWALFGIVAGSFFIFFVLIGSLISLYRKDLTDLYIGIGLGLLAGLFFGYMVSDAFKPAEAGRYVMQYEVRISDETLSDFLERYEIIDQDGDIYTIREKW